MSIKTSSRIEKVAPSQTLSIGTLAAKIRAQGKDVINLSSGQPDYDTPDHIKQAAIEAIRAGKTKYTAVSGTTALKQAIADKMKRENALNYDAEKQVLVSCGAKHSLYNLCQALLDDGDEAIIPVPFWVSYPEMVKLAGGKPVLVPANHSHQLKIGPDELRRSITPATRLLFLNSPNNPSGAVYSAQELLALAEVLLEHPHIMIVSDDIYEHILFGGRTFSNIVNVCPDLYERTLVINGVSKVYSMTGWRIGYTCGHTDIISSMKKIQSQSTSNPASISQEAAQAALTGPQDFVETFNRLFEERHTCIYDLLCNIQGVECQPAAGSFYSFPNFSVAIAEHPEVSNDLELATYLLEKTHVATVPGMAFGMPGHLRLSFSIDTKKIKSGVARIGEALQR